MTDVNNAIYQTLGERWYTADDDPVALLRAENRFRNPILIEQLASLGLEAGAAVVDLGCGAGFLALDLQKAGYKVTAVDAAAGALAVAKARDTSGTIQFCEGDLVELPLESQKYAAVFLMDVLEHVDSPHRVLAEAARVLRPGGLCVFYTFNRNWLAWLLVIKGVEWFVRNTPQHLHVYHLFLRPSELERIFAQIGLQSFDWWGMGPRIWQPALWHLLRTGRVRPDFQFEKKSNLWIGYVGMARK